MRKIVVGVDGSPASEVALQWAVTEAKDRGGSVDVLHAWHVSYAPDGRPPDEHATESAARALLDAVVTRIGAAVRPVLVRAIPASALLDASRQADLVVVGSASSPGMRLGSVTAYVVTHAQSPVVVVPAS